MCGDLTGYNCDKCRNKGYIFFEKNDEIVCRKCECVKVRMSIARIERSGLKNLLDKYTFERFDSSLDYQAYIKSTALKFLENISNARWFFIGGQIGCGKSHICTAIVGELLRGGKEARYMQWRDDVVKIKANANSDEYSKLIEPFKCVEVLYIDDMFKTEAGKAPTTADINIAFEIINHRYINQNYVTIISSEKTIPDMLQVDEAIASRICEYAGEYMVNINRDIKKNYRLKKIL